jgi:hypothetical protein
MKNLVVVAAAALSRSSRRAARRAIARAKSDQATGNIS